MFIYTEKYTESDKRITNNNLYTNNTQIYFKLKKQLKRIKQKTKNWKQ